MRRLFALLAALLLLVGSLSAVAAQDDAPADPQLGDEVTFVDAGGNEAAVLIVEDVIDPFEDSADDPPRRTHFVLVILSIENTGDETFEVDPAAVLLQDADGFLYGAEEIDLGGEEPLEATDLDAGDDVTGAIAYAVPDSAADLARVFFAPDDDRLVLLAALGAGAGPAPTEEATAEATDEPVDETPVVGEGCEGIDQWIDDTLARLVRVGEIFEEVLPEDVDPLAPDFLDNVRAAAAEISELAAAQESGDVPEAAADANDLAVEMLTLYAQSLNDLADAIEIGNTAGVSDAIDTVTEADNLNGELFTALDDLEAACA